MDADIKGCLANINKSYRVFSFDGKPMSKQQVEQVLKYGLSCGYSSVSEIPDSEIKKIVEQLTRDK